MYHWFRHGALCRPLQLHMQRVFQPTGRRQRQSARRQQRHPWKISCPKYIKVYAYICCLNVTFIIQSQRHRLSDRSWCKNRNLLTRIEKWRRMWESSNYDMESMRSGQSLFTPLIEYPCSFMAKNRIIEKSPLSNLALSNRKAFHKAMEQQIKETLTALPSLTATLIKLKYKCSYLYCIQCSFLSYFSA